MISILILCCFFSSILCSFPFKREPDNYNESNVVNITELRDKIKLYEGEFMRIYRKAKNREQMICAKMDENMKLMNELRNNYTATINKIDKGIVNDSYIRSFFDLRADIMFGRRNIEVLMERLNKSRANCFKDHYEMEKAFKEYKAKHKKSEEDLIRTFKQIAQINFDL
jgi:hypothetical protein